MTDCKACAAAELEPWTTGSYHALCLGCEARAFARSPQAKEALLGYPQELIGAMRRVWPGAEQYRLGRIEVYRWIRLIEEARSKA